MADELKKINDYTAAITVENTTSFIAQTVSGTTQRVPLSVMKDNIANDFIKNAELLYDNYRTSGMSGNSDVPVNYGTGDLLVVLTNAEYEHATIYQFYGHKSFVVSTIIGAGDGDEAIKVSIYNRATSSYEETTLTFTTAEVRTTVGLVIYKIYKIKLS